MEYKMKLIDRIHYWSRRHFTAFILGLFIAFGIIDLFNKGHNHLIATLFSFTFGAAFLYRRIKAQNKADLNMAVVIIGCDSGLGYSLALHCRALGFSVIASVLDENGPNVKELMQASIYVYQLDITDKKSVKIFGIAVNELLNKENLSLYALVNNAAVMVVGEFEWQTEEHMMQQVNVNLVGTMRITKEIIPLLRKYKGRIIFISSHCAMEPLPGFSIYGATKSAIRAWATSLRVELKKQNIRVTCFAPGGFILESNIINRQMDYFKEMEALMNMEERNNDFFKKTVHFFEIIKSHVRPQRLSSSVIYETFQDSLLDRYPSASYECCPWRYTYYHTLCKISPTCIRDMLIEEFTQMRR